MRKSQGQQKTSFPQADVSAKIVRAPTDGWDAISPLSVMDPKRAPILDNWVPRPGWVELRGGYTLWHDAPTASPIESLMVRRAATGEQMFAASGNRIFDMSNLGGSAPSVRTGLTNARWQYVNFTPALGTTVIQMVNGADALLQYNGTSWTNPVITGLPVGKTTNDFINIWAQKRRIWYIFKNSTVACYLATDAISGPIAGTLDLGALWTKGGHLVAMCDLTMDGGNGPTDYAAFISSEGQVTLFSGTDPTNAANWSLAGGTFNLAPPIGVRCTLQLGADVAIITQQGVLPLSQALPFDPSSDRSVAITSRIQNAMSLAAISAKENFGWELTAFPNQDLLIMNVPLTENQTAVQYVMDTLTGAWCRFTGWNANCFAIYQNQLFWGDNESSVQLGYAGASDAGIAIVANMQCAFNYFDEPGRIKRMTMVQPLMTITGPAQPTIVVDADFNTSTVVPEIVASGTGAIWDIGFWDRVQWNSTLGVVNQFLSTEAIGHALAIHCYASSNNTTSLNILSFASAPFVDSAAFDAYLQASLPVIKVNAFNAVIDFGGFV